MSIGRKKRTQGKSGSQGKRGKGEKLSKVMKDEKHIFCSPSMLDFRKTLFFEESHRLLYMECRYSCR